MLTNDFPLGLADSILGQAYNILSVLEVYLVKSLHTGAVKASFGWVFASTTTIDVEDSLLLLCSSDDARASSLF